jgi:hypothetical protein
VALCVDNDGGVVALYLAVAVVIAVDVSALLALCGSFLQET